MRLTPKIMKSLGFNWRSVCANFQLISFEFGNVKVDFTHGDHKACLSDKTPINEDDPEWTEIKGCKNISGKYLTVAQLMMAMYQEGVSDGIEQNKDEVSIIFSKLLNGR